MTIKFKDTLKSNPDSVLKDKQNSVKATKRQVSAIVLACLIVLSLSGCQLPPATAASQTTAGTQSVRTTIRPAATAIATTVSTLPASAIKLIKDIGTTDVKKTVTIAGRIEKIERHSGGNAIVQLKDTTGTLSVFLEKTREFDLLRLSVGMACQATGQVQSYKERFELAPVSDRDLVLPGNDRFETVKVTRVSDGDTITVQGSDGRSRKVRVLGVDSPEMPLNGNPAEFFANEAKAFTEKSLLNRTVYLERDNSDTDDYDRQLRYIWLEKPDTITSGTVSEMHYGSILIQGGYAAAYRSGNDDKYRSLFFVTEEKAKAAKTGMWQSQ